MRIIGGLVGIILGFVFLFFSAYWFQLANAGSSIASNFGPILGPIAQVFSPLIQAFQNTVVGTLTLNVGVFTLKLVVWLLLAFLFTWLLNRISSLIYAGVQPPVTGSVTTAVGSAAYRQSERGARPLTSPPALCELILGVLIGFSMIINGGLWLLGSAAVSSVMVVPSGIGFGIIVGIVIAIIIFLALFPAIPRQRWYQSLLSWFGWLMPYSWPAEVIGLFLFLTINFLLRAPFMFPGLALRIVGFIVRASIPTGTTSNLRVDPFTSTFETEITAGLNSAFSIGHFNIVGPPPIRSMFRSVGTSAHEVGHTLNTCLLGTPFLIANLEVLIITAGHDNTLGEFLAESNFPGISVNARPGVTWPPTGVPAATQRRQPYYPLWSA
ncbi:hypothetical protein [Marinicella sp. W31]|uniref:hypothetical protein n=1 Tax=Marinicella sp. W31 TaxID=3023713 RepID=UPI0037580011